jgi:hypothetical protein
MIIMFASGRCSHPVNAPPLRTQKQEQFYNTGESIASSEFQCDGRLFAMPENGMTCKEGGNWTEPVKCIGKYIGHSP